MSGYSILMYVHMFILTKDSCDCTTAYVDYMDLAVRCSRKAVKLNHSLTHSAIALVPAVTGAI